MGSNRDTSKRTLTRGNCAHCSFRVTIEAYLGAEAVTFFFGMVQVSKRRSLKNVGGSACPSFPFIGQSRYKRQRPVASSVGVVSFRFWKSVFPKKVESFTRRSNCNASSLTIPPANRGSLTLKVPSENKMMNVERQKLKALRLFPHSVSEPNEITQAGAHLVGLVRFSILAERVHKIGRTAHTSPSIFQILAQAKKAGTYLVGVVHVPVGEEHVRKEPREDCQEEARQPEGEMYTTMFRSARLLMTRFVNPTANQIRTQHRIDETTRERSILSAAHLAHCL
jgi:hypothetical protein